MHYSSLLMLSYFEFGKKSQEASFLLRVPPLRFIYCLYFLLVLSLQPERLEDSSSMCLCCVVLNPVGKPNLAIKASLASIVVSLADCSLIEGRAGRLEAR